MRLFFDITDKGFECTNPDAASLATEVSYVRCMFNIKSSEWKNMTAIVAVFKSASYNVVEEVLLDSSNSCFIPADVYKKGGVIQVLIYGNRYGEPQKSTTNLTKVTDVYFSPNITVPVPTPYKYDAFLAEWTVAKQELIEYKDYLQDLVDSGAFDGVGIDDVLVTDEGYLVITKTDGVVYTSGVSLIGPQGPQGIQGEKGDQGIQGVQGDVGIGIREVIYNDDDTVTIVLDDDSDYTSDSLRGPKGDTGPQGPKGEQGDNGLFIAVYGQTTYAELEAAINSNKAIYVTGFDSYYTYLSSVSYAELGQIVIHARFGLQLRFFYVSASDNSWTESSTLLQNKLVSGSNIKTINNQSLLGSGNIDIQGGGGASNWVNGSTTGSVRTVGSATEDSSYTIGQYAVAEGYLTTASGDDSHSEGFRTTASGAISHAEGYDSVASGNNSHAEGASTVASGNNSHAEGTSTIASGNFSHAEGYRTTASGDDSYAEGSLTTASGECSHAEGSDTTASGSGSHAQNTSTIAQRRSQTALGEFNIADTQGLDESARGEYAVIVGNGTDYHARSNAMTLDWDGKEWLADTLEVSRDPSTNMEVATKQYVDSHGGGGGASNWVNGSSVGSVRTVGAAAEDSSYTIGQYAVAEGNNTKASGNRSHAEGLLTTASGTSAHAEGGTTTASGIYSHAEGASTRAIGLSAHAEGVRTIASGNYSHAQNYHTIASRSSQTVLGEYNIEDTQGVDETVRGQYSVIVGNGTADDARSNALTIDWSGNVVSSGDFTDGLGNVLSDIATRVAALESRV